MDQMANDGNHADPQRRLADLQRENLTLKGMVVKLNGLLLSGKNEPADDRDTDDARLLRLANGQLVMAAFDAQDGRAAAEALARRQTVFLSMLAHELRNPIAAIAVAGTLAAGLDIVHPRLHKLLGIVGRQAGHLTRLVDDLLDASRIETGKISLQKRRVSLSDVLDLALEIAQPLLTARGQDALLDMPPAPLLIDGDPVRLAQLFSNLLINASKFSAPRQTITLSASLQQDMVEVVVRDQGRGIAPEDQARIFDLFAQVAQEPGQAFCAGLGIGLTLVRSIAELHGGSVRVDSAGAGCGSAFIVLLPAQGARSDWAHPP
jgi:signal transduction histidine kinase